MSFATKHSADETPQHVPVMLREVVATLAPRDGGVYVDGTFGAGGYSRAILEKANCTVYGIDRDPEAFARAKAFERDFKDRFIPLQGCFGDTAQLLADAGVTKIDGFVLDLGVSSIQLSTASRGFSFRENGPLDMRMSLEGVSAKDVVNTATEKDLADIIYTYGEEKASRRIAKRIIEARAEKEIETTAELTAVIHSVLPMHGGIKTDTATRTFQALRIYVNDELGELDRALAAAPSLLATDGRFVVVSFHSLEDWRVKTFFREQSGKAASVSRHMPLLPEKTKTIFTLPEKNGLAPTDEEIAINGRSRSARLRYGVRTAEDAADA